MTTYTTIDPTAPYAFPDAVDPRLRYPHVMLGAGVSRILCGCTVEGHGILPSPVIIRHCPTHAQAPAMLAALRDLIKADDIDPRTWPAITGASIVYSDAFEQARAILRAVEG